MAALVTSSPENAKDSAISEVPNGHIPNNKEVKSVWTAYITNSDGHRLFCKYWKPENLPPKFLVFIGHGFAEHCQVYDRLAVALSNKLQAFVFSHDHRGHGLSEGVRVLVNNLHQYVKDVFQHIDVIKQQFPDLPLFYIGHSMGGAIGILAGLTRPKEFSGVCLVAPAIAPNGDVTTAFKVLKKVDVLSVHVLVARILGHFVPSLPLVPVDFNQVTRDKAIVKMMQDDPLRWQGFVKIGWGWAMLAGQQEIAKSMKKIEFPFFIVHGDADKVCHINGSKLMLDKAKSKDKTLKIYPNAYHALFFEPDGVSDQTHNDLVCWIRDRVTPT